MKMTRTGKKVALIVLAAVLYPFLILGPDDAGHDPPIAIAKVVIKSLFFFAICAVLLLLTNATPRRIADWLRGLLRRRPRAAALLVGLAFAGIALCAAEGACYVINRQYATTEDAVVVGSQSYYQPDDLLGYVHRPGAVSDVVKSDVEGRQIYAVRYSINELGQRVTTHPTATADGPQVAFFGCSFTFGEGLNDNETIPSQFAKAAPAFRVCNFGVAGYGPNQMLALLAVRGRTVFPTTDPTAIGVYIFIDHHVARAAGSMYVTNRYGAHAPCYELDTDDRLVYRGNFTSARPFQSILYWALGKSQIVRFLQRQSVPRYSAAQISLTARIIAQTRDQFEALTGSERFFVVLYPGSTCAAAIQAELHRRGVCCLDCSTLFDPAASGLSIVGDGHPTAEANRLLAAALAQHISASIR